MQGWRSRLTVLETLRPATAVAGRSQPVPPAVTSLSGIGPITFATGELDTSRYPVSKFLTGLPSERRISVDGSLPLVWAQWYGIRAMLRRSSYLPVLEKAIPAAKPRPEIPHYNQLNLAISSTIHQAMETRRPVNATVMALSRELTSIIRNS